MNNSDNLQSGIFTKNSIIIFGITLIAVMGIASITPAFPGIISYFNISTQQIGLLVASFTLPGIFLTPLTGIIADRFGRKIVLVPSLFVFGIAGFICSFIQEFNLLLVFIFIEGIGASGLSGINITLIGDLYTGSKRTAIMGYNASILSIGTAAYPAIGGFIAIFGWQYIFYLPLLAIPLGIYVLLKFENPKQTNNMKLAEYFKSVWLSINKKSVWGLFSINLLIFVILYGSFLTYFPVMLSDKLDASSAQIGLSMSVMSLVTAGVSSRLAIISRTFSSKKILLSGILFYFFSMIVLSICTNWLHVILSVILFGLGHGLLIPSIQNLLVGFTSVNERAAVMSFNSMVLRIGQTLGPILIGLIYIIGGVSWAFVGGAITAIIMFLIVLGLIKNKLSVES